MQLQTVRPNIVQSIRAYRVEDLMSAANDAGQHFLYANLADAQTKQDVLDGIAEAFTVPGALRQEPRRAVRLHDRPGPQVGQQPGFVVVLEQMPDNPRSTAKRASSCSTCSATPPTSGPTEKYRSDVSILFSSPLPGNRVKGAGDGSGPRTPATASRPKTGAKAARSGQLEFRHEHAADEQRVRHRDVAERRVATAAPK